MQEEAKHIDTTNLEEEYTGELQEPDFSQPLVIDSDLYASEKLDSLSRRVAKIRDLKQLRDDLVNKTTEFYDMQIEKIARQMAYFHLALRAYMEAKNAANPKCKSMKFSSGNLCLRKKPDKIVIDEAFKPESWQSDIFVRFKTIWSVDKTAIAKELKDTGQLPSYATVEEGEVKFDITFND